MHLVVDGYNVTKTGYPTLPLDEQRARLIRDLAPLVARRGAEVTVVFSPPGVIADELIQRLVAAEPRGRPVVVVSTDREVATTVARSGARAVPSATLLALLARG